MVIIMLRQKKMHNNLFMMIQRLPLTDTQKKVFHVFISTEIGGSFACHMDDHTFVHFWLILKTNKKAFSLDKHWKFMTEKTKFIIMLKIDRPYATATIPCVDARGIIHSKFKSPAYRWYWYTEYTKYTKCVSSQIHSWKRKRNIFGFHKTNIALVVVVAQNFNPICSSGMWWWE